MIIQGLFHIVILELIGNKWVEGIIMAAKILVVDDEMRIRKIIGDFLRNDGYLVIEAIDGFDALNNFNAQKDIDLIVLDVMMPGKTGWEVCEQIRNISNVPIIFMTALGESHDEIHGLNIGADDYLVKPFRYEIFMARIRNILRRSGKVHETMWCANEIKVDFSSRTVKRNEEIIDMSPREYELLTYLVNNQNIALERDKILDAVWGYDFYGDRRTVDTHIKNIRAKLGSLGPCIKTIRGFGYKFEVKR